MDQLYRELCFCLEDEAERQELVLAVTRAMNSAALAHDAGALQARAQALQHLVKEAVHAEPARLDLVTRLAAAWSLPRHECTLTHLIDRAPAGPGRRLLDAQARLQNALVASRTSARDTMRVMRKSLAVVGSCLELLDGAGASAKPYVRPGAVPVATRPQPAMLDQRG